MIKFVKELDEASRAEVRTFYDSLKLVTIEQHPDWQVAVYNRNRYSYFILRKDSRIRCFAVIAEQGVSLFRMATIAFGPLFIEPDDLVESISEIRKYYRHKGYAYLGVQLAMPTGSATDYIECQVAKRFHFIQKFDKSNWSTLVVDLTLTNDQIWKGFSKGHKSAIKRSITDGVTSRMLKTDEEVGAFAAIYLKMTRSRNLHELDKNEIQRIHKFLTTEEKGYILGVFDVQNALVGGVILVFQGDTVRYFKGASDPDRREMSLLHVALFEAIKSAKESGFKRFDLWGYNFFVTEEDQVFHINRFKKGFSKDYMFYPRLMHIELIKGSYWLVRLIMRHGQKVRSVIRIFQRRK